MEAGSMRRRFAEARVAHLATVTPSGRPHLVPCCFVLDRDTVYSAVDAKPKSTTALQRLANVRATPAVSLLVDHYDDGDWSALWWIRIDGRGQIVDAQGAIRRALDVLCAKYPQYQREPPPGPVLAIQIERWKAWP